MKVKLIKTGEIKEVNKEDICFQHRIMCGDSTKKEDVDKLMNGQKADMVLTDPPYGMNLDTDWSDAKSKSSFVEEKGLNSFSGNKYEKVIGDSIDYNPQHIFDYFDCKEIFLWGADYYAERLTNKNTGSWFVWDKRSNEGTDTDKVKQSDKMYGSCFELCWSKARHKRELVRIKWAGIFGTEKEPDKDKSRIHPTQKPVELSKFFILKFSQIDNLIVDLFLGSGSTLIACEQTNRICYGMELDPKYCEVICQRWEKLTNKKRELVI
jgi:DNA modification methylase